MRKTMYFKSEDEFEAWSDSFEDRNGCDEIPTVIEDGKRIMMDMITNCKTWKTAVRRFRKAFAECGEKVVGWIDGIEESCGNGYFFDREGWKPAWMSDPKEIAAYGNKYGRYAWAVEEIDDGCWYVYLNLSGGWWKEEESV